MTKNRNQSALRRASDWVARRATGAAVTAAAIFTVLVAAATPVSAQATSGSGAADQIDGAISDGIQVWRTDGPGWLAALVVYAVLRRFLSEQHVLAKGRLLAALTGLSMVLYATLAWRLWGGPLDGIPAALVAAVALVIHPEVPATQAAKLRDAAQAGAATAQASAAQATAASSPPPGSYPVALAVLCAGWVLAANLSCATVRDQAGTAAAGGVSAFLDCEAAGLPQDTLHDAVLLAESAVQRWLSGRGTIDEEGLLADMEPIRTNLGQCAIAAAIAAVRSVGHGSGSGTPGTASAALVADADQIGGAFSRIRRKLGWKPTKYELEWATSPQGTQGEVRDPRGTASSAESEAR